MKPRKPTPPRILHSRKNAASSLSISVRTIDYLIAARELATRTIGSRRLIPDSELIKYSRRDHPGPIVSRKGRRVPGAPSPSNRDDAIPDKPQNRNEGEKL